MNQLSLEDELCTAVGNANLTNLREIVERKDKRGRVVTKDDDICIPLFKAAQHGQVEACRILYNQLSSSKKKHYKVRTSHHDNYSPPHVAVVRGHLPVVRLFVEEFECNINKKNFLGQTLLHHATVSLEMTRYFLEHGANPNQAGYIFMQINRDDFNTHVESHHRVEKNNPRITDLAILNGKTELLSLLLQHGALIAKRSARFVPETSLSLLLLDAGRTTVTRETKLEICRLLVEHAKAGESSTAVFLQSSLENAVHYDRSTDSCAILLESGVVPTARNNRALYYAIRRENEAFCRLLLQHGADPFLHQKFEGHASPFQAAARKAGTTILSLFLEQWDERFSSNGGKNNDGDYPIHVLCCDPKVSLPAIELVAARQPDTLATVDREQGLFPFHFAAMWNVKLDLIFTLLKHCPDALFRLRLHAHSTADGASGNHDGASRSNETLQVSESSGSGVGGPLKKKAKTAH